MKKFLLITITLFFLVNFSSGVFADTVKDTYFEKYESDSKAFCESTSLKVSPWFPDMEYLLKKPKPPYTNFMDEGINTKYNNYLKDIGTEGLGNTLNLLTSGPFEKARIIYIESQNTIFNCAILKAKIKIGKAVIAYISKSEGDTNIIAKIKKQNDMIEKELEKETCTSIGEGKKNVGYKTILLNNVTYEYCLYKYYLNYLNSFLNNNINQYLAQINKNKDDFFKNWNTQDLSTYLVKQKDMILNEDNHARNVYKQAIIAYEEFENTYGSHLMLMFIYDDYIQVRNNMKKLLNPISQLILKIPQAQNQNDGD